MFFALLALSASSYAGKDTSKKKKQPKAQTAQQAKWEKLKAQRASAAKNKRANPSMEAMQRKINYENKMKEYNEARKGGIESRDQYANINKDRKLANMEFEEKVKTTKHDSEKNKYEREKEKQKWEEEQAGAGAEDAGDE